MTESLDIDYTVQIPWAFLDLDQPWDGSPDDLDRLLVEAAKASLGTQD